MITRTYNTFSESKASDNAFLALEDIAKLTTDLEATRLIGGLMTLLLLEAFPTPGTVARHTSDVDTAVSVELASQGTLHARLVKAGYEASKGNRYVRGDRIIDILVPSDREVFRRTVHGGRAFDSVPGVKLALAGSPILHRVGAELTSGEVLDIEIRTPTPEHAVVIKALATRTRDEIRDLIDIHNLLLVADHNDSEQLGGWQLDSPTLIGTRRDTRLAVHALVKRSDLRARLSEAGLSTPGFAQLAQEKVGLRFASQ